MTEWVDIETPKGFFVKFTEPGDEIIGSVVAYNATSGATDYDGNDCGFLVLEDDSGDNWTVTLDKNALRDAVAAASPTKGKLMRVRFDRWNESKNGRKYKAFKVSVAATAAANRQSVKDDGPDADPF